MRLKKLHSGTITSATRHTPGGLKEGLYALTISASLLPATPAIADESGFKVKGLTRITPDIDTYEGIYYVDLPREEFPTYRLIDHLLRDMIKEIETPEPKRSYYRVVSAISYVRLSRSESASIKTLSDGTTRCESFYGHVPGFGDGTEFGLLLSDYPIIVADDYWVGCPEADPNNRSLVNFYLTSMSRADPNATLTYDIDKKSFNFEREKERVRK